MKKWDRRLVSSLPQEMNCNRCTAFAFSRTCYRVYSHSNECGPSYSDDTIYSPSFSFVVVFVVVVCCCCCSVHPPLSLLHFLFVVSCLAGVVFVFGIKLREMIRKKQNERKLLRSSESAPRVVEIKVLSRFLRS